MIYVDDLKMAGPTAQLPKGWEMLREELRLEEETPLGLYLGCRISKGEAVLYDKTPVRTVTYDMETYLDMTVKKCCDVTGFDPSKFRTIPSPSPAEETKNHPARAPACNNKSHRSTWCGHTMCPSAVDSTSTYSKGPNGRGSHRGKPRSTSTSSGQHPYEIALRRQNLAF